VLYLALLWLTQAVGYLRLLSHLDFLALLAVALYHYEQILVPEAAVPLLAIFLPIFAKTCPYF
jgi:hypothetical protein